MGDPRMTERLEGGDRMFKIVDVASDASVGSVGFWTKEWRDEQIYEVGWIVMPEFQGRGIAVAETTTGASESRGLIYSVAE
jgi:RimJ/RimL family protein N-acetyltransferase